MAISNVMGCLPHWIKNKNQHILQWQPTPVFLPGKSHGQWSLAASMRWQESDMISK